MTRLRYRWIMPILVASLVGGGIAGAQNLDTAPIGITAATAMQYPLHWTPNWLVDTSTLDPAKPLTDKQRITWMMAMIEAQRAQAAALGHIAYVQAQNLEEIKTSLQSLQTTLSKGLSVSASVDITPITSQLKDIQSKLAVLTASSGSGDGGPPVVSGPININTASEETLEQLPHVGPTTARAIMALRPITSLQELLPINGINAERLADIAPLVILKTEPTDGQQDQPTIDIGKMPHRWNLGTTTALKIPVTGSGSLTVIIYPLRDSQNATTVTLTAPGWSIPASTLNTLKPGDYTMSFFGGSTTSLLTVVE